MALSATLTPVNQANGSLAFGSIDAPSHMMVNQFLRAQLLSAVSAPANGKKVQVSGFEPCVYIYGTAATFNLIVYTSPDGVNWVAVATITEATVIKALGRNELRFPVHSIAADLTAVAGGNVNVQVYAERRK